MMSYLTRIREKPTTDTAWTALRAELAVVAGWMIFSACSQEWAEEAADNHKRRESSQSPSRSMSRWPIFIMEKL